jgi:hypothetical protein
MHLYRSQRHLASLGVTKELFHGELQKRAQRLEALQQQEMQPMQQVIQSYRNLPPVCRLNTQSAIEHERLLYC